MGNKFLYELIYFKRWKSEKAAKPYKNETKIVYVPKGNVWIIISIFDKNFRRSKYE